MGTSHLDLFLVYGTGDLPVGDLSLCLSLQEEAEVTNMGEVELKKATYVGEEDKLKCSA